MQTFENADSATGPEPPESIDRVVVIGTGFIGLPLAILLAKHGRTVVGVDIDENIVDAINDQSLNLDDDDLQSLLEDESVKANLKAQTSPADGEAFVISVPTPLTHPQRNPDLSHVEAAIDSIIPHLSAGNLVNIESTIPPLTCNDVIAPKLEAAGFVPGENIHLTHAPERILPGNVFEEIVTNDRIIGGTDDEGTRQAASLYEPFLEGDIYFTDLVSAELTKLIENTYRDVNIALANELALIGGELGVDIDSVIDMANKHPRVDLLKPGIGVGGHCLPVDPWFLNEVDPEHTNLITTARRINDHIPEVATRNVRRALSGFSDPEIVALGAAYKPNTYDTRNSPAIEIVDELRLDGYSVIHYDRHVDGMDYDGIDQLLDEHDPDVILQIVPHDETNAELAEIEDRLASENVALLRFGVNSPHAP